MKRFSLLILVILAVASGCDKNALDVEKAGQSVQDLGYVPLDNARGVANFFVSTKINSNNKRARQGVKKVIETITVNDSLGKPSFYVMNYDDNEGFVIVSAEKKINPILAFGDVGNFSFDTFNAGVSLWTSDLKKMVNFFRKNKDATEIKGASDQWEKYSRAQSGPITTNSIEPDPDPGCQDKTVNNFILTTWGQNGGYNEFCPVATGGPCDHAPTGCVATSMMQIMRYYSKPTSVYDSHHFGTIEWWNMPMAATGSCTTTWNERKIASMMRSVGERVGMNYGAAGSGAPANKPEQVFKNDYGYASSTNRSNYNHSVVLSELDAARPVMLDGGSGSGAHQWLATGYRRIHASDCSHSFLFLYMNWGWAGLNDAFYSFDNWTTTLQGVTYNFNSNKHMTVVHP